MLTLDLPIACVVGATLICVDALVRLLPGKRNFRIEDSNVFLASALSLSFGVMLFSSLNMMLPESKGYLKNAQWSDQSAGLIMMSCFIAGFIGIQALTRLLHQFMPSHVVDCDHSHDETATQESPSCQHSRRHSRARRRISRSRPSRHHDSRITQNGNGKVHESTPLLDNGSFGPSERHASVRGDRIKRPVSPLTRTDTRGRSRTNETTSTTSDRRPSIYQVQKRVMSFVKDTKCNCDELGSCYGFTDPCGQECFKHIANRPSQSGFRHGAILRTTTGPFYPQSGSVFHGTHPHDHEEAGEASPRYRTSRAESRDPVSPNTEGDADIEEEHYDSCSSAADQDSDGQHHHHVPTNAFLSIGLQTSIAIALHKFPEGFITYATNHANPAVGFNVFMALFVHNISEGFVIALPLYMALGSRWKAMLWSALLGGLSQPLGAGFAVLWFKLASRTHMNPNAVAYACLFAITAGIMVSVALQLFVESLSLNHNRNLCIFFGFMGMAVMGLSNALVGGGHH